MSKIQLSKCFLEKANLKFIKLPIYFSPNLFQFGIYFAFFQELIEINTRYQDLSNTVEQRLKWACGANPDLQEVFDKFSSSFSAEMEAMRTLIGISKTLSASANTIMQ